MEKILLFVIILVVLLALLLGVGIRPALLHAINTSAAQPETITEAIDASRAANTAGSSLAACLPLAALAIIAAGWLLSRSGETLRQARLTFGPRRGRRRPIRPIPTLPPLPTVQALPTLPDTTEEP